MLGSEQAGRGIDNGGKRLEAGEAACVAEVTRQAGLGCNKHCLFLVLYIVCLLGLGRPDSWKGGWDRILRSAQ